MTEIKKYPLLGHLPSFLSDKLGFLMEATKKHRDVVQLRIGKKTFLLNNAEDIKYVLAGNAKNYEKTPRLTSPRGRKFSGKGLLTTFNSEHLRQRRMLQPAFHHKAIAKFANIAVEVTQKKINKWQVEQKINIAEEMMSLAQQVVLMALFGDDIKGRLKEISEAISLRRSYTSYIFGSLFPFPEYLPLRINFRYRKAIRLIDGFIFKAIKKRRNSEIPSPDLLTMLMQQQYNDGNVMTDQQVRDEAIIICITGYETIGEALTWAIYNLSQHEDVQKKLNTEINSVLNEQLPTIKELPKLIYTEMVVAEAMRLYPPTWIFIRMANETDQLPSGTKIPAGSKIYLCPYVVHRNPKYFPNPERYDPHRFLSAIKKERPKFAYFPFGGGPRLCIGEPFAKMEYTLVLACIAQKYKLSLVPGQKIVPHPGITLRACLELKFCIYSILFSIILEFAKNTQATELSTVLS